MQHINITIEFPGVEVVENVIILSTILHKGLHWHSGELI